VLRKFAAVSGGEFFEPRTLDDVQPVLEKISKDIRSRYTIGYTPDEVNDKHSVRTVKVTASDASGQKLIVKTRTSYIAAPLKRMLAEQKENQTRDLEK
jgi:hypothetical protein